MIMIVTMMIIIIGRGMIRWETLIELNVYQFELFELILLLKLDRRFPVQQFEPTVSQSAVPSPPLQVSLNYIEVISLNNL